MTIDEIIQHTIKLEGGYSNHKNDNGGETNYGITSNVARANGYNGLMINLPLDKAISIYKNEYFTKPKINLVYDIDNTIAAKLFDIGVNAGTSRSIKIFQEALSLLNKNQKLYSNLTIDGLLGNQSINALKIIKSTNNGIPTLLKMINLLQGELYINICRKNESQEDFIWGWINGRISI